MPASTVIMLIGVTGAFAVFAITLAWAQLHTRDVKQVPASPAKETGPKRKAA